MHSSRYSSEAPYTRRDGMSREGYEAGEENKTVEVFVKFRTFRPYLKKRLNKILKDGRQRELKEEVEDIKYYLTVMSDMSADDNHGGDALQGFIDRIHEMIRKNPTNDSHASSHASLGDDEDDTDEEGPPRSPSPTEIIDADDPAPARPIPLEREQQGKEFSYFASLEKNLGNRSKPAPPSTLNWGLGSANDTYRRRGSFQDIDMRGESRFKPMENSASLGRGTSSMNNSRRWDSDIGSNREGFGRGVTMDGLHRDRDERPARDHNSSFVGTSDRYGDRDRSDPWNESTNWNSLGQGVDSLRRNEDYDRQRGRGPADFLSQREERYDSEERGYNWDRQPYERSSGYSRDTSYDRQRDNQRNQDEPLFERRPQFERRRNPSGNNVESEGSVQIEYNHGGGAAEQSWDGSGSVGGGLDKDMRGAVPQSSPAANLYGTNPFDPQQQFFMNQAAMNTFLPNSMGAMNSMMGMNVGMPNMQQNLGVPSNMNIQKGQGVGHMGFNNRPSVNSRPGLLPTPAASMPEQDFAFRNPNSQPQRTTGPQTPETFLPVNSGNDPAHIISSASSSNMMKEITRQKAQQCFSRQSPRKDNQNVPPLARNQSNTTTTCLPPPNKVSQVGMLASNQMLSDRDPRLHRLKKMNPTSNASQNDATHVTSERPKATEPRRAESTEPRIGSKNQDETRDRIAGTDPRLSRVGATFDPRRGKVRVEPSAFDPRQAKSRSERPPDIAPFDPRGAKMREERARLNPSDPRQGQGQVKIRDEYRDRNPTYNPRGGSKSRDEIPDRNSKVNDESKSNSKNLEEIRDRVKANMNNIASKSTAKTSKLQEIRKQVEKEGFHPLGRQSSKKTGSTFDEALNPPVEKSPPRSVAKPFVKSKSRDASIEKGTQNLPTQKALKEKTRDTQSKNSVGKGLSSRGPERVETQKKRVRINKRKQNTLHPTSEDIPTSEKPTTIRYRIPKIKRPDPIPPPEPPEPSYSGDSSEIPDDGTTSSIQDDVTPLEDDNVETPVADTNGHLTSETEELVKRFIRQSVDATEAEYILKNEEAVSQVFRLLKQQVQQMCHDEQPSVSSSALNSQASETAATVETATELPSQALGIDEPKDSELNEAGTHRSRSTTRKKSAKRRSSLEKLHDALQEMRFDAALPLGPRKCTRLPAVKSNEVPIPSDTTEATERTRPSKQPKIILNKDDLNQILASTENKRASSSGVELFDPDSNVIAEDEMSLNPGQSEGMSTSMPSRRGRKRKRKGSKSKPNKKKKGPVTRAQAAVKTALKHQQKDKGKSISSEPTETLKKNKRKVVLQPGESKTEGQRVTRSMIGRNCIVPNLGLDKIKVEADYLPTKIEPEDQNFEDSIDDGTGYEDLCLDHGVIPSDSVQPNDPSEKHLNFMEFPSCIDLENDDEDDDRMSIDIKTEQDYDGNVEQEENLDHNQSSVPVITESETELIYNLPELIKSEPDPEPEPDTDYGTDLSFLPTIPQINSVYSLNTVFRKETLDNLLVKTTEDIEDEPRETECPRHDNIDHSSLKDCDELLSWMLSTVEFQSDESCKVAFQTQCTRLSNISPVDFLEISEGESAAVSNLSDDEEMDEPNDFYVNVDDSDDDEYESNDQTESEVEETNDAPSGINTGTSLMKINEQHLRMMIDDDEEEDFTKVIRNNEKNILIDRNYQLVIQDFPDHGLLHSKLVPVTRVGDGFHLSTLLQGFVSPITLSMPQQKRELDEVSKLGPAWSGSRSNSIKSLEKYDEMLQKEKLTHLFKCMGTYCSYSGECKEEFLIHLMSHYNMDSYAAKSENDDMEVNINKCARFIPYQDSKTLKDWNGCSYCCLSYKSPNDLRDHVINQHSQSIYQCGYCFYRAYYHRYVVRHCENVHRDKDCCIIKSNQKSQSDYVEANVFRIYVYKCGLENCKNSTKRFIFRDDFINHLQLCSPSNTSYPCHLCHIELPMNLLIEHYKSHSLFKYHCSYCRFASEEKEDLDSHFYNLHPNVSGRVFSRESNQTKPSENSKIPVLKIEASKSNEYDEKSITLAPTTALETTAHPTNIESLVTGLGNEDSAKQKIISTSELSKNAVFDSLAPEMGVKLEEKEGIKSQIGRVNAMKPDCYFTDRDNEENIVFDAENKRIINLEGQDLYRCANKPCIFMGVNATLFKDHVTSCIFALENKQVSCFHCDKRVKAIPNLLEHLKVHGRRKQICSICPFKTWIHSELTRHMKTTHKVYNYKVEKIEVEEDEEPDVIVFPKEVACRIISLETLQENLSRYADKLLFGPDDIDKVPARHIFHTLAYCSLCSYSTKVRVNIIRHLKLHNASQEDANRTIPDSDPVNPVPCLERKELMFDKMTNWAGSTHAHKPGPSASSDTSAVPIFVLEQFRYVCSVTSCRQITTDDVMLKAHMRALHSNVEVYRCPHCCKDDATKKDPRNTVPIDKIGNHLKLHGGKLYRCTYCDYIHHHPGGLEKHLPDKHPEKKPIHYLIRNVDGNGALVTRNPDDENASASGKWRCSVCNSKNLFASYEEVKSHCRTIHRVLGQFICAFCRYFTDSDVSMKQHVLETCREKISDEQQIMTMWVRNEFADTVKLEDIFHGPLWKRSSHNVKHIRGIFLEDVKERGWKSDNTCSKSSSPGMGPEMPNNNFAPPISVGKKSSGKSTESLTTTSPTVATSTNKSQIVMVCPKCNRYKTKNRQDMTVHLFNELGYQRYGCPKCNLKFVTENSLKGHYSGDHGLIYDEKLCQLLPVDKTVEAFIRDYYAEQDELAKASEPHEGKSLEGQLLCKHCSHPCNSYHNLRTHILAKHIASDRFKCNYCSLAFYSEGLCYNHIKKSHADMPLALTVNAELQSKLTPEFWMEEYGIPGKKGPEKKSTTLLPMDTDEMSNPVENHRCPHCNFTTVEFNVLDAHIEEYHNEDKCHSPNSDDANGVGNNGAKSFTASMNFLDELLGDMDVGEDLLHGLKMNRKENTNVYKCFHCKDTFFTVRGARSHWKRIHSKIPEERCIYYEFKAFDDSMKLPPGMELWCCQCDYKVSSMIFMQSHHQTFHRNEVFRMKRRTRVGTKIYTCSQCFHECSQMSAIEDHSELIHPGTQIEYTVADVKSIESAEEVEYFGKLIEDAVRYSCVICKKDFNFRLECKSHQRSHHQTAKEPSMKYSRKVLNHRVKVPTDCEDQDDKPKFGCPTCNFVSEDRQKLITDHLPQHIPSYLCLICDSSFQTFVEAKFHIRHSHADPTNNPSINPGLFEAREMLEKMVIEVPGKKKINTKMFNINKQTKPREVTKRKMPAPVVDNHCFETTEVQNNEDDDDDIFIEDIIIVNPSSNNLSNINTYGRENGKVGLKKMREFLEQGTSTRQAQENTPNNNWNLFEDYEEFPKLKTLKENEKDEEPDIIEIPAANSGIQWDLDSIPEFSNVSDGDPFINTSSFNWEEWEGGKG